MWSQLLNESRSQRKFGNRSVIILGAKHSGKRSLVDSLFDISKTTLHSKRHSAETKMRLKGTTTGIDYAYLNVADMQDPDNRTHAKLEIYMVEETEPSSIYSQLAQPALLKNSTFVVMLDFTNPWNFILELEKWIKFIYQLQKMAQLTIGDLQEMAQKLTNYYKKFRESEFDENGKLKARMNFQEQDEEQLTLPLPQGVLTNSIRVPLIVCVNKCDLQSQVLREESNTKILLIMYHLRHLCVKYGASLIYTSIRNNSNLGVLYEYVLHRAYQFPLRFRPDVVNQQAIFIPFGYDKPSLIDDSVVKIDVSKPYNEVIPQPAVKKQTKEEVLVEEDSKFFEKYINQNQAMSSASTQPTEKESVAQPFERKKEEVTDFFKNLLTGGTRNNTLGSRTASDQSQRMLNAEKELLKHTAQVLEKKNLEPQ